MANLPPCAGIIVINKNDLMHETILVSTSFDNYSFPKGKRNKGESSLDCAWRELNEETGLTKEDVELVDNFTIDENSDRGNVATRYFVGKLKNKRDISFDKDELKNAEWITLDNAYKLEKFKDRRKDILKQSYEKILCL